MKFLLSLPLLHGLLLISASAQFSDDSRPVQNANELEMCLRTIYIDQPPKTNGVPVLTFPENGSDYNEARLTWRGDNYPAAITYARSIDQIVSTVQCTVTNGYRISVRGHGHSSQGSAIISGYVIVDVSLMCTPESFEVDKSQRGEHILPGSKYIAVMKTSAGCTNSALMAALDENFGVEERAVIVTGGWASVGVGGFTLGGGVGELTPFAGYAIDVLTAVDMVLWDGSIIKATKDNEYSDLFWSCQGGGGGIGIVTNYYYRVIENPNEEGLLTRMTVWYNLTDDSAKKDFMFALNNFTYNQDLVPLTSLYGGSGNVFPGGLTSEFQITYLGGWKEALDGLRELNLYGEGVPLSSDNPSKLVVDWEQMCGPGTSECSEEDFSLPPGISVVEVHSGQAKAWAHESTCGLNLIGMMGSSAYICDDLGIDDETFCADVEEVQPGLSPVRKIVCPKLKVPESAEYTNAFVSHMLQAAKDPESVLNSVGMSRKYKADMAALNLTIPGSITKRSTISGGLLIPELSEEALTKLFFEHFIMITHFQHAAPLQVDSNATALPWRNSGWMASYYGPGLEDDVSYMDTLVDIIAEDDPKKVNGYYNNLWPYGPGWKRLYFGDNYPRLSQIKAKYDPNEIFSKPVTVGLPEEEGYCADSEDKTAASVASCRVAGYGFLMMTSSLIGFLYCVM